MKRVFFAFFAILTALNSCADKAADGLVVKTEAGMIRGYEDRGVLAFTNIPYCRYERFMPPRKPDPWTGILDCNTFPPMTMQYRGRNPEDYDSLKVSEDGGTRLNVWTKSTSGKKPVMVWLHGGGFASGAGYAGPSDSGTGLAKQDVVLVSVNHRLDIMGFLDLSAYGEKYEYSGNVGMMDIVVALEWVRDNISNFGGDPDNVTVFGESGGGGKVGTLLCMPSAKGLFHKAIIMSGTLLNLNSASVTRSYADLMLKKLGLTSDELDKLAEIPYPELYKAGHEAINEVSGERPRGYAYSWGFAPTVDGKILLQQPFQPSFASCSADIPIIIGTTFNELERTYYKEKPSLEEARAILYERYGDQTDAYIEAFSKAYPEYDTPADMLSVDRTFRPFTLPTTDARADENTAPVFSYIYAWKSPVRDGAAGACHGFELPMVFHTPEEAPGIVGEMTPEVEAVADMMSRAWVSFAKTGKPEVEGLDWRPYTSSEGAVMYLGGKSEVRCNFDRDLTAIMQRHLAAPEGRFSQAEAMP